jgi:hypothetical protein
MEDELDREEEVESQVGRSREVSRQKSIECWAGVLEKTDG